MGSRKPIQSVLIVGYGVMGKGVSATFAAAGFDTAIKSSRAAELEDLPDGVTATSDFPAAAPDLVIEFVPEVIGWFEQGVIPLAAELRPDPRLQVLLDDVYGRLAKPPGAHSPQ